MVDDATTFLSTLDDRKLRCRDLGHNWQVRVKWHRQPDTLGFRRILKCSSCSTRRIDVAGVNGMRILQRYEYVPDYQFKGSSQNRLTRPDFRAESIRRVVDDEEDTPKRKKR